MFGKGNSVLCDGCERPVIHTDGTVLCAGRFDLPQGKLPGGHRVQCMECHEKYSWKERNNLEGIEFSKFM